LALRHIQDESNTSSIWDGKDRSSSSRLQDRGLIDYNTLRVKTSQIPGMYRTYKSFTHKKTCSDSCSSSAPRRFPSNSIWRPCAIESGI
jgi:hypothetical protein